MQKAKRKSPTLKEEQKLWQQGYAFVVGLDEVGRGPLAGPVIACAFCFCKKQNAQANLKIKNARPASLGEAGGKLKILEDIKDSKKLSVNQREEWYEFLTTHQDIKWGIGLVSAKIIDQINILGATKLAMKRAIERLKKKGVRPEYLLLDGNFSIRIARACPAVRGKRNANTRPRLDGESRRAPTRIIPCKSVIRGDEKIWSCAAASIIAKVTRDRLMVKYHQKFPAYGFDRHKGYGTRAHFTALKKHGPCAIHRRTFSPFK